MSEGVSIVFTWRDESLKSYFVTIGGLMKSQFVGTYEIVKKSTSYLRNFLWGLLKR